ncbi:MAG: TonB-dependent receptor [Rhodothermia bacterium]|nr:TonB-dependent receptor [Rhodothermia bacterium]
MMRSIADLVSPVHTLVNGRSQPASTFPAALILLIVAFIAATALPASGQAIVEGTVRSQDGEPLGDASVTLVDPRSRQTRYGEVTDSAGTFLFDAVAPDNYLLEVQHIGFATATYAIEASEGIPVRLLIGLATRSVAHDEVVVADYRARRQVTPITFSNLTASDLERQPDMKDLPVVLSSVPSVTYYSENGNGIGYSTLRMRGFDQRRIAVAINGIPQNDPEDFNVFWINFFDIQGAVQDIQVQRGAGSAFYGSTAIGGAINIVARPYRHFPYAELEIGAGGLGTRRFTAEANSGVLGGRYVLFGRLSRLESDGYRDWSWSEFWRFFGGVTRYGQRSTWTLQAYGGPQKDGLAFSGIPRESNSATVEGPNGASIDRMFNASGATRDTESFHQPHVELHHDLEVSARSRLHQSFFYVKGEGYFDFGATFRSANYLMLPDGFVPESQRDLPLFISSPATDLKFRAYLDQWQIGWIPRLKITSRVGETTLGGELRLHRSLRWGRIQESAGLPADLVGDAGRRVYEYKGEKTIASVQVSHTLRYADRVALQADLQMTHRRYRVFDEKFFGTDLAKPYLFVNPRIGVTVYPQRPLSLYASIAYASREPRLKSLYDGEEAGAGFTPRFETTPDGSFDYDRPLVSEERLVDLEAGATWRTSRSVVTLNAYWMEFFDEIVPSGGLDQFGVPRTGNADRTKHAGLEAEVSASISRLMSLQTNLSYGRARYRRFSEFVRQPNNSVVELERDGNPIPGFPELTGFTQLAISAGGLNVAAAARYASRQYIDNSGGRLPDGSAAESLTVDPYVLVDVTTNYDMPDHSAFKGLSFGFDVNNILNSEVLLFGNVGPVGPQFFPTATRHVLFSVKYRLR